MHVYKAWNAAMSTTSVQASVTTGTSTKTMLQIAAPSTRKLTVISWGYVLNGPPNGQVELIQTDVAATVTAHVASGVQPLDPGMPASQVTLGTSATGYTATAEGSITATRTFDAGILTSTAAPSWEYNYQFMPDERPVVAVSTFLRVRVSMGSAVNMVCWVCWAE